MTDHPSIETEAKSYQRIRQKLSLLNLCLTPMLLVLFFASPLSRTLCEWSAIFSSNQFVLVGTYFFLFSLTMLIFDLPMTVYSGYFLEHAFGLSNQTLGAWAGQFIKRAVLSFLFSLLLIIALYAIVWNYPARWFWFAWIGYVAITIIMGKLFPTLIVPLFYRYSPLQDESLKERILKLASRFKMPLKDIYSLNLSKSTKKANAAFMGMGKSKRVVLSDTLLSQFNHDEIEMVLAHELGHFVHRDIWRQFAMSTLFSFLAFWIAFQVMDPLAKSFGYAGIHDIAAMPILFLIFYGVMVILMPVQNGYSRWLEKAADRFALENYPNKDVFISCMRKLGAVNLADPNPHPLYEWFFYDHPSIGRRIAFAEKWR